MDKAVKVFLCEDDATLGPLLSDFLNAKGYTTSIFTDGQDGYDAFVNDPTAWDICVLDVMMPRKDGFELAAEIKQLNKNIPIIFLTARTMSEDIEKGFNLGADDYLKKPFNTSELIMRIDAVLRRVKGKKVDDVPYYSLGDFIFDTQQQTLVYKDEEVEHLTTKESDLLKYLCLYANELLDRNYALVEIWGESTYFNARSMDVYITKLRKKLERDPRIQIKNQHGKGYKLITPGNNPEPDEDNTVVL